MRNSTVLIRLSILLCMIMRRNEGIYKTDYWTHLNFLRL